MNALKVSRFRALHSLPRYTQVEHARQETAGSNEIPLISWQQYSHEWIRWPDLFGFCGNRQEPATTGNRIRSPVHCIGFLPFSDGIPAKYCTFPRGFHRKCMGILLPGNIDLGSFILNVSKAFYFKIFQRIVRLIF